MPSISEITFIENDGDYASASTGDSSEGISVSDDSLSIGVSSGSEQWAFSSN